MARGEKGRVGEGEGAWRGLRDRRPEGLMNQSNNELGCLVRGC